MRRLWRTPVGLLALVLWVVTCALGMFEIYLLQDTAVEIYRRLGGVYWVGWNVRNVAVLILTLLYIVFAIGTGEYHYRRVGQRASWRLFGWTISAELAILILCYFV